jgi:hypothetical protein
MGSTDMASNKIVPITEGVQKPKRQRISAGSGNGGIGIEITARVIREPGPADSVPQKQPEVTDPTAPLISSRETTNLPQKESRYWIANDGSVNAAAEAPEPVDAVGSFSTLEELRAVTGGWPMRRLVSVWNQLAGKRPVTRFENRSIATERLWRAIEQQSAVLAERRPNEEKGGRPTKAECILALLRAPGGATLEALMAATGWQAHSIRGFVSGKVCKELGLQVESVRRDGQRVYCLRPPASGEQS